MDRRDFLQSATLVATAGATGALGRRGRHRRDRASCPGRRRVGPGWRRRSGASRAADQALGRTAVGARQHHSGERHRLGPAALDLLERAVRHRGQRRLRRHPAAGEEIRRLLAGLRGGRAAARGGARAAEGGARARHGARELFHGGDPLGRRAMADRREQRAEPRLQQEKARVLHGATPGSPIIASSRCGFRSTARRCRPGSICRPAIPAAAFRWSCSFPAWTASRKRACGCMAIPT